MAKPLSYTYFDVPKAANALRWMAVLILGLFFSLIAFYACTADGYPPPDDVHVEVK